MGLVSFTPFGRGTVSSTGHIDTPYTAIRDLSDTNIDWQNFHPLAGVSETYIIWDRHNHQDGTLGLAVIRAVNLVDTKSAVDHCQVVFSQEAKTLALFGLHELFGTGWDSTIYVEFASTSLSRQSFALGTVPQIMLGVYVGYGVSTGFLGANLWVTGVTSQGFTVEGLWHDAGDTGLYAISDLTLAYFAVGAAPGYLDPLGR